MLTLGDLWRKVISSEATAECFGSSPGGERSLLSWAAERGEEEMVQTLADRGAAVDPDDVSDHTPLGWAVCGGDLALLNLLLDKGAGVDVRNKSGSTPLHGAILLKRLAVAAALLDRGADPDAPDRDGQLPICKAVERADLETLTLLLDHKASTEGSLEPGDGRMDEMAWPLLGATIISHELMVKKLLDHGADTEPSSHRATWRTPVDFAASVGNTKILDLLLRRGANPNTSREPLHVALEDGHVAAVKVLLRYGAKNTQILDPRSLFKAVSKRRRDMVQVLLENGANPNAPERSCGITPLHEAVLNVDEETVKLLLEHEQGSNIPVPLTQAARSGCWSIVKLLAERGARLMVAGSPSRIDLSAEPPILSYVVYVGSEEAAWMIIKQGAKVDGKDHVGRTPLSLASSSKSSESIIRMLIEEGADVNSSDFFHRTPLSYVASAGGEKALRLLIEHGASVHSRCLSGRSVLSYAAKEGDISIFLLIFENCFGLKGDTKRFCSVIQKEELLLSYAV